MDEELKINVDDKKLQVISGITVKKALKLSGYNVTKFPEKEALFVPCGVGGCLSCAVLIDGGPKPACKVIDAIVDCRTEYRDGTIYQCEPHGQTHIVYRSCINPDKPGQRRRHCHNFRHFLR